MLVNESVVRILTKTNKHHYINNLNKTGVIKRNYKNKYGVYFEDVHNPSSELGLFWYDKEDLEIINKQEELEVKNYNYVAIVNMFNDSNPIKKNYAFALYNTEKDLLTKTETLELLYDSPLVVTNSCGKNNRTLATVKEIIKVEDYTGCKITAQVVGVVNMNGYMERKAEEEREAELKRKKDDLTMKIQERVDKLNNLAYYERIADMFSDIDPGLSSLVAELKDLNGINSLMNKSLDVN